MKKENGKKSLAWLWILIAILAVLAIAGGVLGAIFLGGLFNQPEENVEPEPEKIMSDLYWNVDRKEMIDPETGLSIREAAADGMYYMRLAVNGEQKEIPVADKKLVNRMDILDVFGLQFDAEGNVVDLIAPEDMYTKIGEKVFVQSIEGNTMIVNTSQALNGMQIPVTLTGNEGVFNVSTLERPAFDGEATELEIMDQVLIYGSDETTAHTIYVTDRFWESDVYWRIVRKYDSTNKCTAREQQPDGYWYFDMASRGQIKTYRTNRQDVINAIDGYGVNSACCGLVFDENGDVIDCFNAAMAARGYLAANGYNITELSEDGKTFTATRVMMGNEVGKTYTSTITEETEIYNVNTTADFIGQATELQLRDYCYIIADTKGNAKVIFIIIRHVDSPMYYLLNRSYSSALGMTATPDADGYYNFTFAVKGKQKKFKTKDKELAEQIHTYGYNMMGLKVSGDKVLQAYNPECVSGNYSFAGNYFVTSFADPLLSAQSSSGTAANGVLVEGAEIYDVSGVDRVKGKKAKLREGDRIICYTNEQGEITHVYITARYVAGTKVYWNINTRSYDSEKFETKATKNADGYYTFKVIKPGKGEIELKTTSKEVASQFHAIGTGIPIALKVSGDTLKAAYPGWAAIEGGGYYSLANTTLTEETEDGGYKALTTTYIYGTLRLGSDCKTYNVSTLSNIKKFRGEATSVRLGDRVYPIYSYQGAAKYVFITEREVSGTKLYWKSDRRYNSTTQETTRVPDADGYYVFKVTVDGKVQTIKTKDKKLASYMDSGSLAMAAKVSGGIIKSVYTAAAHPDVYAGQVSYRDVTKISGAKITTKRNKPFQTDTGAVTEIEKASNCKVINVSPTAGDNWGKKITLQRGDRVYTYKDNFGKTSYIYVVQECTRSDGGYAKCSECGKTVWWEPFTAGCSVAAGGKIDKNVHYYLDGDLDRNASVTFGGVNQKTETVKFVFDLYGRTITRIGTESFDAETGLSKGFFASGGVLSVTQGNTLTIINSTKKVGGIYAGEGVQWTGATVLMSSGSDTKPKADDPATEANETQAQIDSLGYDTAKFDETATLIIKAGIFDASKAISNYKAANSGVVSVGGNLIVKGGELIGIKSTSTNITANAAAIGTWGGSNVTIEGGIVRGCPVEEGDIAGPGGAAISANSSNGVIKITGGEIIGSHTSGAEGSAIYNGNAELIITGGTIRGGVLSNAAAPVVVSGKPVITNEFNGGLTPANKISVGALETGASIQLNTVGIFTTDFETEEAAEAVKVAEYFKSETPIIRLEKALATGEYRCLYGHTTVEENEAAGCKEELTFWKAWDDAEALPTNGNYYLTGDVTVSANTAVGNLVLDLKGHTITRDIFAGNNAYTFSASPNCSLRLCDSTETPGKLVGVVNGFDGNITVSAGLISSSSPITDKATGAITAPGGAITIDRITVDGSALTCSYVTANTGVIVAGGDMVINDATILGYKINTKGNGTAIGSWGNSSITINGNSTIIGGSASPTAASGKGQGGVIALGNGPLTINGGTFKTYDDADKTKHGGIIMNNGGAKAIITINGGTFYGNDCTGRGGVIHASSYPVYINGGTFYAANTANGGVLCTTGNAFITGGTFIGSDDGSIKSTNGGLIYSSGNLTITGGVFKNGNDVNGGPNIYFEGNETKTLTIAGTADIAGETIVYRKNATTQTNLVVGGKALVDFTRGEFSKSRNLRLAMVKVYLNEVGETPIADLTNTSSALYSLTYDCAGNVTGIIAGTTPQMDDHDFDATGKCTKCGEQAEGETRCVNGHATATECEAAGCTAEIKFFRPWEETTSLPTAGAWYLTENVTVTTNTNLAGELALDLNGKTITRMGAFDNIQVYGAGFNKLHLGDSAATAGTITVNVDALEGGIVKSVNGMLSSSSPSGDKRGTMIIDRITVDASAVKDNLYIGNWKTEESHLTNAEKSTAVALTDGAGKTLVYLNKALESGGVPLVRTAINAGAIIAGGDLIINGATIKGYQHTQGRGTAIGSWGKATVTINEGSVIIGGSASAVGSKALFGTENDFSAISGLGEGGVIAMGDADLTINGGTFSAYEGAVTKHGAIISVGGKGATINGGTFYGNTVTANGAVINHSSYPLTINGGTFYAAKSNQGGILSGSGVLTINGGEFIGVGNDATKKTGNGGLIYNNGKKVDILGGTFKNGNASGWGCNIAYTNAAGVLTIGGDAKIAGEVRCYRGSGESGTVSLVLKDKAIVDYTLGEFSMNRNLMLSSTNVYLNDTTGTPIYDATATSAVVLNLTHDAEGNVTGVVKP